METLALKKKIKIEVVSDIACPWCYIGKKRMEKAIELSKEKFDFDISFRPFQLDARIPVAGVDYKEHLQKKFGSSGRMEEIFNRVESAGESVGIDFQFMQIPKAINTIPLHMLLHIAEKEGIQKPVADALFEAYMVKPVDLSDEQVLVNIMQKFGWEEAKTKEILANITLRGRVENQIDKYHQMGISGVPFFIINDKYGVSGAQATETFVSAFQSLKPEDFPAQENMACDIDGNC